MCRKIISIIIVSLLLVSAFSMSAQGVLRMKKGTASYGSPVIDGVMDDCYKNSSELIVEFMSSMNNNATEDDLPNRATGKARLCWDETALYLYIDVKDPTPVTWLDAFGSDAVEFTCDFDSLGDGTYGDNGIFVVTLPYARTVGKPELERQWPDLGTAHQDWLMERPDGEWPVQCVIKADGYTIELKVPLNDAVKAMMKPGFTFGFQISLLDDIDDNNQRDIKSSWGESTDDISAGGWSNSDSNDEITLIEAPPAPVAPEPEPEPDIVQAEEPAAPVVPVAPASAVPSVPETGDTSIIIIAAIMITAAAGVVIFRRKTEVK